MNQRTLSFGKLNSIQVDGESEDTALIKNAEKLTTKGLVVRLFPFVIFLGLTVALVMEIVQRFEPPTPAPEDDSNDDADDNYARACLANSACTGLSGDCCPNETGEYLSCCKEPDNSIVKDEPAPKCSKHAACEGMSGDCCPTGAGEYLGCCSV
eukprot:FR742089.1.p1 GENE.FR742089.1~~FR742089.1.p1  ORF type:complete len:154 (+),score=11.13 FR742089.1:75-536(+)